jgi:hypothetical protein
LKAIGFDDAFDAARADEETTLADLLSDDIGRGIRVEKAVTDDLAHDLIGPAVVGLGAPALAEEGDGPPFPIGVQDLVVALLGEAELPCGPQRAEGFTFALEEHGQPWGDLVPGRDLEEAAGADEDTVATDELEHGGFSWSQGFERPNAHRSRVYENAASKSS